MTTFPSGNPLTDEEGRQYLELMGLAKTAGWELLGLAYALVGINQQVDDDPMRPTLLLEAALTHQRCLIEFFLGRNGRWNPRDITARSFLAGWDPQVSLSASHTLLQHELPEIDQRLAHISRTRLLVAIAEWDVAPVSAALIEAMRALTRELYAVPTFEAQCLDAWLQMTEKLLGERNLDLTQPLSVRPVHTIMLATPVGEQSGRVAALVRRLGWAY